MSFSTFLTDRINKAREATIGLQSLHEYTQSVLQKFESFVDGSGDLSQTIVIPYDVSGSEAQVIQITKQQMQDALNNTSETISAVTSQSGATIDISCDLLSDMMETYISEMRVQKEFLGAVLAGVITTAQQFATNILTKYQSISASIVDKYSNYFNSGDNLTAMRQWLNDRNAASVLKDDNAGTITLYKRSDYTGQSVWLIVIADFKNTITGFFDKCWQGIQDLAGFFSRLWIAIGDLTVWLLSKVAQPLTTNFTKGEANIGICDLPLFQVKIWDYNTPATLDTSLANAWTKFFNNVRDGVTEMSSPVNTTNSKYKNDYMSIAERQYHEAGMVKQICESSNPEILEYQSSDILFQGSAPDRNLIFRMGYIPADGIYLQIFYGCPQNYYGQFKDRELYTLMRYSLGDFILELQKEFMNTATGADYPAKGTVYISADTFLTDLSESESLSNGPLDLYSHVRYLSNAEVDADTFDLSGQCPYTRGESVWIWIQTCLLPWLWLNSQGADHIDIDSNDELTYPQASLLFRGSDQWTNFNIYPFDNHLSKTYVDLYRPYLKTSLYGVSLHYQSLQEQATEIERYIIGALVAIAVVVVSIKAAKISKNVHAKAVIARGAADNASWNYGPNPSSAQVREWKKLNKVANRWERFESLTGNLSPVKAMQSVKDRVFSNNECATISIDSVFNAITGAH